MQVGGPVNAEPDALLTLTTKGIGLVCASVEKVTIHLFMALNSL